MTENRIQKLLEQRAQAVLDLDATRVAAIDLELARLGAQATPPHKRATKRLQPA